MLAFSSDERAFNIESYFRTVARETSPPRIDAQSRSMPSRTKGTERQGPIPAHGHNSNEVYFNAVFDLELYAVTIEASPSRFDEQPRSRLRRFSEAADRLSAGVRGYVKRGSRGTHSPTDRIGGLGEKKRAKPDFLPLKQLYETRSDLHHIQLVFLHSHNMWTVSVRTLRLVEECLESIKEPVVGSEEMERNKRVLKEKIRGLVSRSIGNDTSSDNINENGKANMTRSSSYRHGMRKEATSCD
ncbi:hypothetical protein ANN_15511 [Periplaneta americana]|uniref:Uncharacterized protein n=1 Tax=Periplaneta americana TaxID=6978 RepID=A0ABQ8SHW9_PERAM|nr:hypothetical protein ANN_15511 [Periplaneta americana]